MPTVYRDFDQAELDREYSPSSCVDDINLYLEQYAQFSAEAKRQALKKFRCEFDLKYGSGKEETLDLFLPNNAVGRPLHVFVHGGYWQALSKNESCFSANNFLQNDTAFAAINYTLAPQQSLSGIVDEVRRAIAWLYRHSERLGFDKERIYLSGSSAGAHLAMMTLFANWNDFDVPDNIVKGVCAISGVYDLRPIQLSYVNDVIGMDQAETMQNSPALHTIQNPCSVILCYGDNETNEFKRQTDEVYELLKKQNIETICREIEGTNHFDIVFELMNETSWLFKQVQKQMASP